MTTYTAHENPQLAAIAESLTIPSMAAPGPAIDLEDMERYRITPIKRVLILLTATLMGATLLMIPAATITYATDRLAAINDINANQLVPGQPPQMNPNPNITLKPAS